MKSEILTWIYRTIRHFGDDLQQRLHRVVGQLVDVERPRRGPGAGADAEPRISRFDVGVVVELDFEVGDPRGERLADEDIVLKRWNIESYFFNNSRQFWPRAAQLRPKLFTWRKETVAEM